MMTAAFDIPFSYDSVFRGNPGYAFYGVLCGRFHPAFSQDLHREETLLLHQYVTLDRRKRQGRWKIYCYTKQTAEEVRDALLEKHLTVRGVPILLGRGTEMFLPAGAGLTHEAEVRFGGSRRFLLTFHTATTFRQNGVHVIFPTPALIFQSILARRNALSKNPENDPDAWNMLLRGCHISAYRLESSYYPLKAGFVPGFRGQLVLSLNLAEPMRLFARDLLCFSERVGVGAKTTLGMGGVTVEPATRGANPEQT